MREPARHEQLLAAEGFGFECVSPGEIAAVRTALPGIDPGRILFTPSFAPRGEYAAALALGVHVTLDALHPLAQWGALFAGHDIRLRVDLGSGRGHHGKVRTGGAESKFGLPLDQLEAFRALARANGTRIVGLHAHASEESGIIAWVGPGFPVKINSCEQGWCAVVATDHPAGGAPSNYSGYLPEADLWGVYQGENFD